MVNISIISYRKLSFAKRYGFTVRDLMILKELAKLENVESINWLERPSLPHEILMDCMSGNIFLDKKINAVKKLDLNLIAALRHGRLRSASSMSSLWSPSDDFNHKPASIVLDFHPFFIPPRQLIEGNYYWYDLIDNFTKHNRYSPREKAFAEAKYKFVEKYANLVTGVSTDAVSRFNGCVLPNKIIKPDIEKRYGSPTYDVGFLGFITNKFDIDFLKRLSEKNISCIIYGHAYDKEIANKIKSIRNVTYGGPFKAANSQEIISKFRVGIIPYKPELSHDESPIKFYLYISEGRPVVSSKMFDEIEKTLPDYVKYYDSSNIDGICEFIISYRINFESKSNELKNKNVAKNGAYWGEDLQSIVDNIIRQM